MTKHDKRVKYQSDAERPVMLSLRIPPELYDRLERYAREHRQPVSELVRDGIEMRLEVEADPRSNRAGSTTEETLEQIDGASILREVRDMRATLERHETQMEARMQAIERQTTPAGNGVPDGVSYPVIHSHTGVEPAGQERTAEPQGTIPAYDTTKHHLDSLCKRGHDYQGSGQSLRNSDNQCLECKREAKAAKDARKKAAREADRVAG